MKRSLQARSRRIEFRPLKQLRHETPAGLQPAPGKGRRAFEQV